MVLVSIFIVLAVGILAFAYITSVYGHEVESKAVAEGVPLTDPFEQAYEQKLDWMHELEGELSTGKLDQSDYARQKTLLEKEALALLEQKEAYEKANLDGSKKDVEEMIQDRRMERIERSGGFCVKCGKPLQRSDQFCPSCGSKRD